MKSNFLSLLLIPLSLVPAFAAPAPPAPVEVIVGVSPCLAPTHKKSVADALLVYLLQTAPMGTRVSFWDAWDLTSVATVDVPVLKLADAPQARVQQREFAASLGRLKRWFEATSNAPVIRELSHTAALKAPEWLELISRQPAAGQRSVLLLGSPLYLNLTEPTFSMTEARYPADGHLRARLTESVFGLAEKSNRLAGTTVPWCYFTEQAWQTELHRTAVTRFWGLFMQGQNGCLATFGADLPSALANSVRAGMPSCGRFVIDLEDDKLEMRTAAPRAIPLWMQNLRSDPPNSASSGGVSTNTTPVPAPFATPDPQPEPVPVSAALPEPIQQAIPAPPPALTPIAEPKAPAPVPAPAPPPPPPPAAPSASPIPPPDSFPVQTSTDKTGFGIAWAANGVDLDLYVKAHPRASELYYRRTVTGEGRYYHDYRNRNVDLDYEYVELKNPVDLRQVKVWVNYYRGLARNVTGKVCVHYQGRTFIGDFRLAANYGNRGADSQLRAISPYWREINLEKLVGLASSRN